jgi:hypothetical protein
MEPMNIRLVEKLESIFVKTAMPHAKLKQMALNELLYYALVESGDDRGMLRAGATQGA